MKTKALIIGYGITGRSAAKALAEAGFDVTVWSDQPVDQLPTTSANAYAIWVPVRLDDLRIELWTTVSYQAFVALSKVPTTGVELRQMLKLKRVHEEQPWFHTLPNYRQAQPDEIYPGYVDGFVLDDVPVIDPPTYLRWLHEQAVSLSVKFEQRKVTSFDDIPSEFAEVVNCTGLGSRELAGDKTLFAQRVQVLKVRSNGWNKVVIDEAANTCIVPHGDSTSGNGYIKLGGFIDSGDESLEPDPRVTADIIERCCKMVPGFEVKEGDVLEVTRALRPEMPHYAPRVERLQLGDRHITHVYGHDGMGYLLSIGISDYVAKLLLGQE